MAPVLPLISNNGITGTWSPAVINTSVVGTTTYTFTPAAGQCATTATLNITIDVQITPVFTAIGPLCVNAAAPALPATSNNGISGTWTPAVINTAVIGTTTYTFTPTAGQCATATTTLEITVAPTVTPSFAAIAPICSGSAAPVLPTTSLNGITGTWSPAMVSNTVSGTYTFTPDAGQCATSTTIDVTVTPAVTPTFAAIAPICFGSVAPTLPLTSLNGITGTWSPAVVGNTVSSTYTFTPDAGQCANKTTLDIMINPIPAAVISGDATICTGETATLSIALTGTSPWSVTYSDGSTSVTVNNITVSTYSFAVSPATSKTYSITAVIDANCNGEFSGTALVNVSSVTPAVTISASSTSICTGTPVTFTATPVNGGIAPSYQWQVNGINTGTNSDVFTSSTLVEGDVVSVIMTSNATCLTISTATSNAVTMTESNVTPAVTITASSTSVCSGGSITFTAIPVNGGTAPSYIWKINGITVPDETASVFTTTALKNNDVVSVEMTSNAGCLTAATASSNSVTITISDVSVTANAPDIACGVSTGTITAVAANGTAPYAYSIDGVNFVSGNVFTGLAAGNYIITARDAGGCTSVTSITISQLSSTITATATAPDLACGFSNGTITVTAANGVEPYTYSIDGGLNYQASNVFNNQPAGNYTITVRDANGCTAVVPVTIKQLSSTITATATAPDLACGFSNGTITVAAANGVEPYIYSIDGGLNYQASNVFNNIPAGDYTITVRDAGGCTAVTLVTIRQLSSTITATATAPDLACGFSNGTITVAAANGVEPYIYSIDGGLNYQASNVFNNMPAGNYAITVRDAGGCTAVTSVTIRQLSSTITATATAPDLACGSANGTITVTAVNGVEPYTYSKDGGLNYQASNVFNNLPAGDYTITVRDAGGCTAITLVTIRQLSSTITATATAPDLACGFTNGTITVIAANGVDPYSYSIDGGLNYQASNVFNNLPAGNYNITVRDAAGCTTVAPVTINQLSSTLTFTTTAPDIACGLSNGRITVNASNGTEPYSYSIDGGANYQAFNVFNNLAAGTYTITVRDAGGCTSAAPVTLNQTAFCYCCICHST